MVGTLIDFKIVHSVAGSGDRTVDVDVQRSHAGGAFGTVLTAPAQIVVASPIWTPIGAIIDEPDQVADDVLALIVTLGGSAGAYPQGLFASLLFEETYQ